MLNLKIGLNLGFFAYQGRENEPIPMEFDVEEYTKGILLNATFVPG